MVITTEVQGIIDLVNQVNLVMIPAIIGLITGVLSIVNHFRNSKKITDLQYNIGQVGGKVETAISANVGKLGTGLELASSLSPEVKDAIVKSHPTVIALQTKMDDATKRIQELQAYIDLLKSTGTTQPATT